MERNTHFLTTRFVFHYFLWKIRSVYLHALNCPWKYCKYMYPSLMHAFLSTIRYSSLFSCIAKLPSKIQVKKRNATSIPSSHALLSSSSKLKKTQKQWERERNNVVILNQMVRNLNGPTKFVFPPFLILSPHFSLLLVIQTSDRLQSCKLAFQV